MSKALLPIRAIFALLACGVAPAGAVVVLDTAPPASATDDTPARREQTVPRVESRSTDPASWGIGIAALGIAGFAMRRRTPSRIVSS